MWHHIWHVTLRADASTKKKRQKPNKIALKRSVAVYCINHKWTNQGFMISNYCEYHSFCWILNEIANRFLFNFTMFWLVDFVIKCFNTWEMYQVKWKKNCIQYWNIFPRNYWFNHFECFSLQQFWLSLFDRSTIIQKDIVEQWITFWSIQSLG